MRALLKRELHMYIMNRTIISSIFLLIIVVKNNTELFSNTAGKAVSCIMFSWLCLEQTLVCLNNENKNKGDCYFAALPFSRTQLTLIKYMSPLFIMFITVALGVVGYCLGDSDVFLVAGLLIIPLVSLLLLLPIYYWLGGVKGARICTLAIISCATIFSVVFASLLDYIELTFIFNEGFPILLVMLAILYFCSFLLSVHFYKKRDI